MTLYAAFAVEPPARTPTRRFLPPPDACAGLARVAPGPLYAVCPLAVDGAVVEAIAPFPTRRMAERYAVARQLGAHRVVPYRTP